MAIAGAEATERRAVAGVLARELVYVTGKGGTGKTTVAAALALAAAASGRQTLVCEVGGAHALAGAFKRRAGVAELSIDPHEALLEWMRAQPGGAIAAATLGHSRAFTHFVEAAPGAKELVTIGKAADLARAPAYELIIVDGPATGHALGMLSAPATVGRVARVGPVGEQARVLHRFLVDPHRTGYVGVALAEEMPLHELLELEAGLHEALGRGLDLVVIDAVYPDRFTDDEAALLQALSESIPASGLLQSALTMHRQGRAHADRVRWLRERTPAPVITLPFLFSPELGPAEYEHLARLLNPCAHDSGCRPGR
jgi:Anion-transporting ATPase